MFEWIISSSGECCTQLNIVNQFKILVININFFIDEILGT